MFTNDLNRFGAARANDNGPCRYGDGRVAQMFPGAGGGICAVHAAAEYGPDWATGSPVPAPAEVEPVEPTEVEG